MIGCLHHMIIWFSFAYISGLKYILACKMHHKQGRTGTNPTGGQRRSGIGYYPNRKAMLHPLTSCIFCFLFVHKGTRVFHIRWWLIPRGYWLCSSGDVDFDTENVAFHLQQYHALLQHISLLLYANTVILNCANSIALIPTQ